MASMDTSRIMDSKSQVRTLPWDQIDKACKAFPNLKPEWIAACAMVESGGDRFALRFEPAWKYWLNAAAWALKVKTSQSTEKTAQAMSWSYMQIMGSVARQHGFAGPMPAMCELENCIFYGAKHLSTQVKRYNGNIEDAISAYNAGSSQRSKSNPSKFGNAEHMKRFAEWLLVCTLVQNDRLKGK